MKSLVWKKYAECYTRKLNRTHAYSNGNEERIVKSLGEGIDNFYWH
jgi:uncharacterized C2H2 Zn-finger protein